jgi:putative ABC transport system permease protein
VVGDSFFATMGVPMIAGRAFNAQDMATSPRVAIINQSLAHKKFPNLSPVGKQFKTGDGAAGWVWIVGICADTRI